MPNEWPGNVLQNYSRAAEDYSKQPVDNTVPNENNSAKALTITRISSKKLNFSPEPKMPPNPKKKQPCRQSRCGYFCCLHVCDVFMNFTEN